MVARAGVSRRDRVRAAVNVLSQSGRRIFGLVVTDVKESADSGYYYYEEESEETDSHDDADGPDDLSGQESQEEQDKPPAVASQGRVASPA